MTAQWNKQAKSKGDIEKYLNGEFYQVGDFVTKADDVANCKKYMDYYNNLGLGYSWNKDGKLVYQYYKDIDTELGVIRFKSTAVNPDTLKIPYGKGMNGVPIDGKPFNKGYKTEELPFTGNGFAGGVETDCITPEYEFLKTSDNKYGVYDIMDGAELYKVTKEGEEILMAIFDSKQSNPSHTEVNGCFVRLEDIK